MQSANRIQRPTMARLDFERRAWVAELDHGRPDEAAAQNLMRRIEDLDLAIAATPAADISELGIKFDRLIDALGYQSGDKGSLEAVFISGIREDIRRLNSKDVNA